MPRIFSRICVQALHSYAPSKKCVSPTSDMRIPWVQHISSHSAFTQYMWIGRSGNIQDGLRTCCKTVTKTFTYTALCYIAYTCMCACIISPSRVVPRGTVFVRTCTPVMHVWKDPAQKDKKKSLQNIWQVSILNEYTASMPQMPMMMNMPVSIKGVSRSPTGNHGSSPKFVPRLAGSSPKPSGSSPKTEVNEWHVLHTSGRGVSASWPGLAWIGTKITSSGKISSAH